MWNILHYDAILDCSVSLKTSYNPPDINTGSILIAFAKLPSSRNHIKIYARKIMPSLNRRRKRERERERERNGERKRNKRERLEKRHLIMFCNITLSKNIDYIHLKIGLYCKKNL